MRKSHIIQAFSKMFLIRTRVTKEGEVIPSYPQELKLVDQLIFMPIVIEHVIDYTSPLYDLIPFKESDENGNINEFKDNDFEIIVILQGILEGTGQTTQAKTSYLPSEIKWNHVFEPLMDTTKKNRKATIDFGKFNQTVGIEKLENFSDVNKIKRSSKSIFSKTFPFVFDSSSKEMVYLDEESLSRNLRNGSGVGFFFYLHKMRYPLWVILNKMKKLNKKISKSRSDSALKLIKKNELLKNI